MSTKSSTPRFIPSSYKISAKTGREWASLEITGQKLGAPNKRLLLNQKGLVVKNARVIYSQKNKTIEHVVTRVNRLQSFEEIRLHTSSPLYPGIYVISLEFKPNQFDALSQLAGADLKSVGLRELLPSFDNEEARTNARVELVS